MDFRPPHQQIFGRVLSGWVSRLPTEGLVLDIGCGLGNWVEISSQYGHRVVGLDVDRQACEIANVRVGGISYGIVQYSGGALPFRADSFVGVYAHEVIEHVGDDDGFISEIHRILEEGGSLLLTTPNGNREPLDEQKHSAHIRHYHSDQLGDLLGRQGFKTESLLWRMHSLCGMLDDALSWVGSRFLRNQPVQPGLTHWNPEAQSFSKRLLLTMYKMIRPIISSVVILEYELFKRTREARNMMFVARKGTGVDELESQFGEGRACGLE